METPSRRNFLRQTTESALLAGALSVTGVHTASATRDRTLRLALIGCGGIMSHHSAGLVERKEQVTIAWLCDIDPRQMEGRARQFDGFQSSPPKQTKYFEQVLDDPDVDACIIGTPHHWHAPIAVRAMMAGKDVYIEKPMSHVFSEGPALIAASEKYGRVVQQGSQMRSSPVTQKAAEVLQSGAIGEVKVARAWTAETREPFKAVPDTDPPADVDYDRWLGPAPVRPFNTRRFHSSWRMFRDYGNGEIGDDGIHDLDMAAWGLGIQGLPVKISARGGRMMAYENASEYPDNMNVVYEFPDGKLLIYENYPFTAYGLHGFDNGNVFYGTEGYMIFSRRGAFSTFLGPKGKPGPTEGKELRGKQGYAEHMAEFLNAVRDRALTTKSSAAVSHRSCALVHLGEIAYRTRGSLQFDPLAGRFIDAPEADPLLTKEYRAPWTV